jgi:hypothetical protein
MKNNFTLLVLCFITGFVDAQVIYGDKYFRKLVQSLKKTLNEGSLG